MSIRSRLALWYGALLAVAFVVHVRTHDSDVDASLRSSWEHAVAELGAPAMPMAMRPTLSAPTQAGSAPTATWLIVQGSSTVAIGDANDSVLSRFDAKLAVDGFGDTRLAGDRVRSFGGAVPGIAGMRLVVGASMSAFDAALGELAMILGVMGLAGIVLAATTGWAISAGALRPIAKMSETARAIALSRGFARRVDVREDRHDELAELGRTFNQMLASLDDAYRRQQRFVADVSHELRTPLTAIQGDLDLLARGQLPADEAAATIDEARRETRRLARLIDDLLVLARADAGPQPFVGKPVQLDEVVMEVFRELRVQSGTRLCVVDLDAAVVDGERDRLKQLVLILTDNALNYTPSPGEVCMSLRREGAQIVLTVDDEGIGITPETATRAFERFYRGEEAQRLDPAGTGLGLSIARWIVDRHGGSIVLEPRQPRGSRAIVRIPAVQTEGRAESAAA